MKVHMKQRCIVKFSHAEIVSLVDIHQHSVNETINMNSLRWGVIHFIYSNNVCVCVCVTMPIPGCPVQPVVMTVKKNSVLQLKKLVLSNSIFCAPLSVVVSIRINARHYFQSIAYMIGDLIQSDEVYLKFIQDLNFYNIEFLALKSYLN